jgi:NADH:ubiquinone oxidoreductase subunit 3 (subunit A)
MNDMLILLALIAVAVIAAILSFVAWYLLARRPSGQERKGRFDSDDSAV